MSIIAGLSALPGQSQITGYDRMLRMRATLKDIYVNLDGLYNRTEKTVPDAIYMQIGNDVTSDSNSAVITMKLPLKGSVVTGNDRMSGTEETPITKAGTLYRNNYKKAVSVEEYGVRYQDQKGYGLFKRHIQDLGLWAQQYEGLEVRQALVETYGNSLRFGDTAGVAVPRINRNVYVQGATDAQQPVFDTDPATYVNNIVNSILLAGGGSLAPTTSQEATFRLMNKIAIRALDLLLWPLMIDGNHAFMLTVSELMASAFSDPTWNSNTMGNVWLDYNRLSQEVQNWYGVQGRFRSAAGVDIYIVVDPKCPTLLPAGTAEPYSLTAGYVQPGDVDQRNRSNVNTRDVAILHGRGALVKWDAEPLHFVRQDDDYFRIMGHGIAGVRGIQQLQFDQQSPVAGSNEYYGSMLIILARPVNY